MNLVKLLKLVLSTSIFKINGKAKKYPKVIQLPITNKCNSKCKMCNVWKMDNSNDMTAEEFKLFMKDPIFKKVVAVGINGGEPSLITNLDLYVDEILKLPKIKVLTFISNAFLTDVLLEKLENFHNKCNKKNVKFNVSISLDGVGEVHNMIRVNGKRDVFSDVIKTIDIINNNKKKYCDYFEIACTVVQQNIFSLIELESYAKIKKYNIKYRLGIENKRIGSDQITKQYSVLYNELRQNAKEFFYRRMKMTDTVYEKFKFFSIFYFLNNKKTKRLLGCSWKDEAITIDARGDVFYCAVASEKIGSLREQKGEKIFFDKKNILYRQKLIKSCCDKCIHDYSGRIEFRNILIFLKHELHELLYLRYYKFRKLFL
ncbi:MAG: radical SAM protein [Patescibacteria group bacterium]